MIFPINVCPKKTFGSFAALLHLIFKVPMSFPFSAVEILLQWVYLCTSLLVNLLHVFKAGKGGHNYSIQRSAVQE